MFSVESDPLEDPQQEKACQERARGLTQEAAYQAADYSDANNASRFFRQPHIRDRVKQIKNRRALLADLDHGFVLKNLKAIAKNGEVIGNANLDDFFAHNDKGQRIGIELTDVPRKKMAALGEVTIEQYTEGPPNDPQSIKRTKIRLKTAADAIAANELLGKHMGMWPTKTAVTITDEFSQMTDEELDAFLVRIRKAVDIKTATEPPSS